LDKATDMNCPDCKNKVDELYAIDPDIPAICKECMDAVHWKILMERGLPIGTGIALPPPNT